MSSNKLLADVARCKGVFYVDGNEYQCLDKLNCARHTSPRDPDHPRQVWLLVNKLEATDLCREFISKD
jgi:hypothetical protein